eukprot:CAMPEP_0185478710 /NCGR_PEP_ID=MMETSP1366-20130426/4971_1 /TAXON_ID=38817 /ORGANISM="Gephyrocapsa oceanica, Strain RCC1303" /LENGTH=359 /DNA_ID=CAMNT_0028086017 /DNA_START=36 /DNA_END=1111 /DNA_ORIENTATION=-
MPLSAEQQRERRAVKRAAEEAAGVFRRGRGGLAAGHVWDEQTGTAVPQAPQPPTSPSAEEGESVPLTAGLAVPHYLLDCGEQARRPDHPAWLPFDPDTDDYDSDGSSGEEDSDGGCSKLERRAERFSNNWAAQQACWRREHLASMAKRAAAAVAWDQKHGDRRDAELERVMAMRERDELEYFWVEVRPQAARRLELLDTTVSNPGWMREQHDPLAQRTDSDARPPDRTAFPRGEDGRKDFHHERANYYYDRTGEHLEGPPDAADRRREEADRRGWSKADPPDAGQGALAMPLVGLGERSTTREAMTFPLLSLMTLLTRALEWVRGSCSASSTDCQLVPMFQVGRCPLATRNTLGCRGRG